MLLLYIFFFRQLKREYPSAVVLSTDDYFIENGVYMFEPDLLEDAHKWNQKRGDQTQSRGFACQSVFKLSPQNKISQSGVVHCTSWVKKKKESDFIFSGL